MILLQLPEKNAVRLSWPSCVTHPDRGGLSKEEGTSPGPACADESISLTASHNGPLNSSKAIYFNHPSTHPTSFFRLSASTPPSAWTASRRSKSSSGPRLHSRAPRRPVLGVTPWQPARTHPEAGGVVQFKGQSFCKSESILGPDPKSKIKKGWWLSIFPPIYTLGHVISWHQPVPRSVLGTEPVAAHGLLTRPSHRLNKTFRVSVFAKAGRKAVKRAA